MITKEEAIKKALNYIILRKRDYEEILEDKVAFMQNFEIGVGRKEGDIRDVWNVPYGVQGFDVPTLFFISIDAETGKVLYTIGPHTYVEEWEEEGFEE